MFPAKHSFFEAEFSAGDVIDYYASFLAFLSTALLGLLALYQNNKLSNANVGLSKINNDLVKTQMKPLITVNVYISEDEKEKN